MSGACRACGRQSDSLRTVLIPEDTTTNKLAVLDLCPACAPRAGKP